MITIHAKGDTFLRDLGNNNWVVSINTKTKCMLTYYTDHRMAIEAYQFLIDE